MQGSAMNDYHALLKLFDAAEIIPPPSAAPGSAPEAKPDVDLDRAICEAVGLDVLGETGAERAIRVFATHCRKDAIIKDVGRLRLPNLIQIAGLPAAQKVYLPTGGAAGAPGMYPLPQVQRAIAMVASQTRIPTAAWRGRGCWPGNSGETILVGAGEAAVWDGKSLHKVERPRAAGQFLDLSSSEQWYDFDRLQTYLHEMTPDWAQLQVETMNEIWSRWRWRETHAEDFQYSPYLITGLALATWIQTAWTWRPMVVVRGETSTGKSRLFETLAASYGNLALLSSKSSEAGLRQAVGNKAVAILVDEFENDIHRRKILELLRTSGCGSRQLRGTVDQEGRETALRHISWVAAIEVGLDRAPDRNRFLTFELIPPPQELKGKLNQPHPWDMQELGQRLLAVAVYYQRQALDLHEVLKRETIDGFENRIVESFAVPVSLLACVTPKHEPAALLRLLLEASEPDPTAGETDQADIFGEILASAVRVERGEERSVAQILTSSNPDYEADMERYGIALVNQRRGPRSHEGFFPRDVFIEPKLVRRRLLKDTLWSEQSIDQHIKRLPGAVLRRCMIAGKRVWGYCLDWEFVEKEFLGTKDGF